MNDSGHGVPIGTNPPGSVGAVRHGKNLAVRMSNHAGFVVNEACAATTKHEGAGRGAANMLVPSDDLISQSNRFCMRELSSTFKIVTLWLLLGTLVFLGFKWWEHEQQRSRFVINQGVIEIGRGLDGHYHWSGRINGTPLEFLIDTGASSTALPLELARELGLTLYGQVRTNTAGGVAQGQLARVDLSLEGGVQVDRLQVLVLPQLGDKPLLGMDVLSRLHWSQRNQTMRFTPH